MPLTKDLVENPGLWRLSVMAGAGGMDVFARPVVGEGAAVAASIPFDPASASQAAAVEEAVYANPMLLLPFGKTDIVISDSRALIAPPGTDPGNIATLLRLEPSTVLRTAPIDSRNEVVFGVDSRLDNFIVRTFDTATVTHALAVLGRFYTLKGRRANSANMIVNLGERSADMLVYDHYGLVMARHFDDLDDDDAVYYILAIFREAGLDPETDELLVAGDSNRRLRLSPRLSRFLGLVLPAIFPASAFHGDANALKAPLPLSLLSLI